MSFAITPPCSCLLNIAIVRLVGLIGFVGFMMIFLLLCVLLEERRLGLGAASGELTDANDWEAGAINPFHSSAGAVETVCRG